MYYGENSDLALNSKSTTLNDQKKHMNFIKGMEFEIEDENEVSGVKVQEIGICEGSQKTCTLGENDILVGTQTIASKDGIRRLEFRYLKYIS